MKIFNIFLTNPLFWKEGNNFLVEGDNINSANVFVVLIAAQSNKNNGLAFECLGKRVLDSGCTKTVAGEVWMNEYLSTLSSEDRSSIVEVSSDASFRFGDGEKVPSTANVKIPVKIGNKSVLVVTDVVEKEIPLLLSRESMKKASMELDFCTDSAKMFGEDVRLRLTSSGHF